METKNFKRRAADAAEGVLEFLKYTLMGILIVIVALILTVIYFIPYNPFMFWIWALIAPKQAAQSLRSICNEDRLDLAGELYWTLNKQFRWLLPWRSKKEILKVAPSAERTVAQELRIFNEEDKVKLIENNWLSKEAMDKIWFYEGSGIRELLFPKMPNYLTDAQFGVLVTNNDWDLVIKNLNQTTPSEKKLRKIMDSAFGKEKNAQALKVLCFYAKVRSLPVNLINDIYKTKDISNEELQAIEEALAIFAQKQQIKESQRDTKLWKKLCGIITGIFDENQRMMNLEQYEIYHETGKKLCEQAIVYFLSQENNTEMAKRVIQYELAGKKAEEVSNNICSLIAGDKKLLQIAIDAVEAELVQKIMH